MGLKTELPWVFDIPMGENADRDEGRGVEVDRESLEGTVEHDEGEPHFIVENLDNNTLFIAVTSFDN